MAADSAGRLPKLWKPLQPFSNSYRDFVGSIPVLLSIPLTIENRPRRAAHITVY
jgi:hypothetical protein